MKKSFLQGSGWCSSTTYLIRFFIMAILFGSLTNVNAQHVHSHEMHKSPGTIISCPGSSENMRTQVGVSKKATDDNPFALLLVNNEPTKTKTAIFDITFGPGAEANPDAKAAFQFALDIWATEIVSTVPIKVFAEFRVLDGGTLASAGPSYNVSNFPNAPLPDVSYPAALANSLAGERIFPDEPFDFTVNLSSTTDYYFGTDGNTPDGQFDFISVALHEIGHGLGFLSFRSYNEDTGVGSVRRNGEINTYSRFLVNGDGERLVTDFVDPSTELGRSTL